MLAAPLTSSATDEWLTPPWLLDLVEKVAPIALDPCGHPLAESTRRAQQAIVLPEDGLLADWSALLPPGHLVYCNPPYGHALAKWAAKMATSRCLTVAVVPARVDTRWWAKMAPPLWCALRSRVRFLDGCGGASHSAPFPTAVCLLHADAAAQARFRAAFAGRGIVYTT